MKFLLILTLAQETEEPKVKYQKETVIDFEGLEIEGELVRPQGNLILERKRANFNPLIRLRQDFDAEMSESSKEIE